jgi:hypothetical protein
MAIRFNESPINEYWYRYEDMRYAPPVNEFDEVVGVGSLKVHLREFPVMRRTPKGVWLGGATNYGNYERFVCHEWTKKFACSTIEEAQKSFIARKTRQITIYEARLRDAKLALTIIKVIQHTGQPELEELRWR